MTLELYGPPSGRMAAKGKMDDPGAVRKLAKMLDLGAFTEPHPCIHIGQLSLKRSDGSTFVVKILPGHSADSYEYRYGGVYRRVERGAFLQALAPFGVAAEAFGAYMGE